MKTQTLATLVGLGTLAIGSAAADADITVFDNFLDRRP